MTGDSYFPQLFLRRVTWIFVPSLATETGCHSGLWRPSMILNVLGARAKCRAFQVLLSLKP
jgi:hypothetical protein